MSGEDLYSGIPAPAYSQNWDEQNDPAQRYHYGGKGDDMVNGQYVPGTSGLGQDVSRWRGLGSTTTSTPYIDRGQSDQARGEQIYGLGAQRQGMGYQREALGDTADAIRLSKQAAYGAAPSAAEIYGGKLIDDSINSQMAMAGSARGGPSAVGAAQRQAAFTGAQTQQSGARDLAAMRADEMARGREQYLGAINSYANQGAAYGASGAAYGGAAGGMRGQDIGVATSQANLQNAALDRQQQNQQYYEQLAFNAQKQAQDAAIRQQEGASTTALQQRQNKLQEERDDWGKVKDVFSAGAGLVGGFFSDIRAKEDIYPIGPSAPSGIIHQNPYGEGSSPSAGGDIIRENPYAAAPSSGPSMSPGLALFHGLGGGLHGLSGSGPPMAGAYRPIPSDARCKYIVSDVHAKEAARLKGQAEGMIQGMQASLDAGPSARRLASGTPESNFTTELTPGAEQAYERWRGKTAPWDTGADYDLRGAFADGIERDGRGHMPDTFKRPNHPTFSDESQYAAYGNPGHWDGDRYIVSDERAKQAAYDRGQRDQIETQKSGIADAAIDYAIGPVSGAMLKDVLDRKSVPEGRRDLPRAIAYGAMPKLPSSDDPLADANRAQASSVYTYKPEFAAQAGQTPGEPNVGPMAQTMARDPIASTAVKQDPNTGLMVLDNDKLQKVQSAGIASLQNQIDALRAGAIQGGAAGGMRMRQPTSFTRDRR